MNVDGIFDLGLSDFESLVAFVFGFKVSGLEVVKECGDFGSLFSDLVFEMLAFDFLPGFLVFGKKFLGQLYALNLWLLSVQHCYELIIYYILYYNEQTDNNNFWSIKKYSGYQSYRDWIIFHSFSLVMFR